ncbi:MAG TPA: VWA domain-containing protein, partial [Blastocatellia bacterium]|nr:VWA domain-containing protein [Blastocatellia bacterium]
MKAVNILVLLLTLILLSTYSGLAQQKQPAQDQGDQPVRIETELVQIDVVVTDKQGNIVRDLKREDFVLYEDGKPQTISFFSVHSVTNPARWIKTDSDSAKASRTTAPPSQITPEVSTGRHIVLAIDDIHLAPGNLIFARQALLKFFDKQVTAGDQVALITTSGQLGLYQQFTTDYEVLRRAINRLNVQERAVTSSFDVPRLTPYQAELIDNYDPDATELAVRELMTKMQMTREMALSEVRGKARMITALNANYTMQTLSTLENVIRSLRPLPGRKTMVLLSDGFTLGGSNQGRHQDMRRITDAATRAGVVIYSIDARGLVTGPASMDASQPGFGFEIPPGARQRIENASIEAQRDGLNALARDTGGFPVFNTNDLNLGFQRVLADTES